ncbi:hypothetical protein RchiOBHm_Chr2g0105991 [Rosa chinensis]|uniref:Uncharacterized protein n=1 Tax=Rosa chinensis TaxID=74649 RepID=A0A2P6RNL0_ROSCH|nr:hypothetical protein RchiOBHm_Chr2g0105991 [Rosa chinensis]
MILISLLQMPIQVKIGYYCSLLEWNMRPLPKLDANTIEIFKGLISEIESIFSEKAHKLH